MLRPVDPDDSSFLSSQSGLDLRVGVHPLQLKTRLLLPRTWDQTRQRVHDSFMSAIWSFAARDVRGSITWDALWQHRTESPLHNQLISSRIGEILHTVTIPNGSRVNKLRACPAALLLRHGLAPRRCSRWP